MRLPVPLVLAALLACAAESTMAQTPPAASKPPPPHVIRNGKVSWLLDFTDDGTIFTRGDPKEKTPTVENGHCSGGGCDSEETSNPGLHGSAAGSGLPAPVTAGSGVAADPDADLRQAVSDSKWRDFIAAGGGGPRDRIASLPPNLPGDSIPVSWLAIDQAFKPENVFPPVLTDRISEDLNAWRQDVSSGSMPRVALSVVLPRVESEEEIRSFTTNKLVNPIFARQRRQPDNMDEIRVRMGDLALRHYVKRYADQLEKLEASTEAALVGAEQGTRARSGQMDEGAHVVQARRQAPVPGALLSQMQRSGGSDAGFTSIARRAEVLLPQNFKFSPTLLPPESLARSVIRSETLIEDRPKNADYADLFKRINAAQPVSPQGVRAKELAAAYAKASNAEWRKRNARAQQRAAALKQVAVGMLDIALGATPIVGTAKDLYEGLSGRDLLSGRPLSDGERALRFIFAATAGVGHLVGPPALKAILESADSAVGRAAMDGVATEARYVEAALGGSGSDWVKDAGFLREAGQGYRKYLPNPDTGSMGNFTVGRLEDGITEAEMHRLGTAWVGDGARKTTDYSGLKEIWVSKDQLRQYRAPAWKPAEGHWAANLERRILPRGDIPGGDWESNAHFIISGMAPP